MNKETPKCKTCNVTLYESSGGGYECRNFDCPPGTRERYKESSKLKDEYRPKLLALPASVFTVGEILLIMRDLYSKDYGFELKKLYERQVKPQSN